MRPALEEKNLLNPGETIKLFGLSQRKFYELIGEKYEACPVGEVSARRIYDVLREEMNTWL